jgi:Shikimate kinase
MRKQNVVLIGMPGCGKSTTGVLLATIMGFDFVDTDLLIIKEEGKKLVEIIEEIGNEGFNKVEENLCATLHVKHSVIATGGSVVYGPRAMQNLRNEGMVVFLDVPLGEIEKRIGDYSQRGISLKEGQSIEDLFEERRPLYMKYADIIVNTTDTELSSAAETVRSLVEEEWRKL